MGAQLKTEMKAIPGASFMSMHSKLLQRQCACGQHTTTSGECEECRQKREGMLQRAAVNSVVPVNGVPPIVHEVLNSPGRALDSGTRAFMEPRFGHDFSGVRVHTNARAAESAWAVNALAYTVGRDVVFGEGQYAPETSEGRRLMAHELTHVVQQQGVEGTIQGKLAVGQSDGEYEREADQVAGMISHDVQKECQMRQYIGTVEHPLVQREEASNPLRIRIPDLRYHPPQSTEPPGVQGLPDPLTKSALQSAAQSSFPKFKTEFTIAKSDSGNRLILYFLGVRIQSPSKESFSVGTEGVTIGTARGSIGFGFGGDVSITKTDSPVKFAASIGKDHWEMKLSYPLTTSVPPIDKLQGIFSGANQAIEGITDDIRHAGDFKTVTTRISGRVAPLKSAIEATKGIYKASAGPSFGVSVGGSTEEGPGKERFRLQATFTYLF